MGKGGSENSSYSARGGKSRWMHEEEEPKIDESEFPTLGAQLPRVVRKTKDAKGSPTNAGANGEGSDVSHGNGDHAQDDQPKGDWWRPWKSKASSVPGPSPWRKDDIEEKPEVSAAAEKEAAEAVRCAEEMTYKAQEARQRANEARRRAEAAKQKL